MKVAWELKRAAVNEGWIPHDSSVEEIDELRRRHLAALGVWREACQKRNEIRRRHEAEDAERQASLREMARQGKLPKATAPDSNARQAELTAAEDVVDAANAALDEVITAVCEGLREALPKVDSLIANKRQEAEEARRQAEQLLHEATMQVRAVKKLDQWFDRAVLGRKPTVQNWMWSMPYDQLDLPPADDPPSRDLLAVAGRLED